jgi:hypothetical protein
MKVYIVFFEDGNVYSIYKDKSKAVEEKSKLENLYENATIKEFAVN